MGLLTSSAICTTSFLLGVLFTSLLWDSEILFTKPLTEAMVMQAENYYLTWYYGAPAVKLFLHVAFFATFLTIVAKFARYTDSSFFFSGGSLLVLILTASVYLTITLPSIRTIARDPLNVAAHPAFDPVDLFTKLQSYFARQNTGPLGDSARAKAIAADTASLMTYAERTEHLSVLCAANTIAIALLVGVLVLQVGEWYVEENLVKPVLEAEAEVARAAVTEEKKSQ